MLVPETSPAGDHREAAYDNSRFTTVVGIEVHHITAGEVGAPAVVLLHHFYGSAPTWRHVQADLSVDHHVTAFDRPGFGLTQRLPRDEWDGRNPYTREVSARIVTGLLDEMGADQAVLIGSSAGGTAALETYRLAPERVRALVLVSPAITGDVGPPAALRPALRTRLGRQAGDFVVRRLAGRFTLERISRTWHDPSRAGEEDLEAYRRMLEVDGWAQGLWEAITAEPPPALSGLLARIEVPTLVVTGQQDTVISARLNQRTAAAIPGARFEVLPDCGHTPQEECPDRLLAVVREFLGDLDAQGR